MRTFKGAKISAARRGRAGRSDLGLTLPQAAARADLDKRTLRKLTVEVGEEGVFHAIPIAEGRGTGLRYPEDQFEEDLARAPRCECPVWDEDAGAYYPCGEVAGPSGRCSHHAAKGEPQVELVCQYAPCGAKFTRPVSWLREREGRGHFCSNECKGAAAYEERRRDFREPFSSEESKARQVDISNRVAATGLLDRASAQASPANKYRYSASHMSVAAPSVLRVFDGAPRRLYDAGRLEEWEPPWAHDIDRRANVAKGTHGLAAARRIYGKTAKQRSAEKGTELGPTKKLYPNEIAIARRARAHGWGYRRIANELSRARRARGVEGVSHMTVKRALEKRRTPFLATPRREAKETPKGGAAACCAQGRNP